ncbi:MAG: hypothetical protein JWM62_3323, partial [Frankiales bacterium]|nr:hypothetical protein [Frankiales bacterium]
VQVGGGVVPVATGRIRRPLEQ